MGSHTKRASAVLRPHHRCTKPPNFQGQAGQRSIPAPSAGPACTKSAPSRRALAGKWVTRPCPAPVEVSGKATAVPTVGRLQANGIQEADGSIPFSSTKESLGFSGARESERLHQMCTKRADSVS